MCGLLNRLMLAGAAVLPLSAQAADWQFVLKHDKKEALAFFDMSSVVRLGGKVGLLSMLLRREENNFPNVINAISFEEAYDCKAKTVQRLGETTFGAGMRPMKFTKITTPPMPVTPSTFEQNKLDIVCAPNFTPGKRGILYMPVDTDLPTFRNFFVEQERAAAKALEEAKNKEAGIVPPPQPASIFDRK